MNLLSRGEESGFDLRTIDFGLVLPPQNMSEQIILMSQDSMPSQQGSFFLNMIADTLEYTPPDQLGEGGAIGSHSDVYSLNDLGGGCSHSLKSSPPDCALHHQE